MGGSRSFLMVQLHSPYVTVNYWEIVTYTHILLLSEIPGFQISVTLDHIFHGHSDSHLIV